MQAKLKITIVMETATRTFQVTLPVVDAAFFRRQSHNMGWVLTPIRSKRTAEPKVKMTEEELTYQIRGAIFDVYNSLGPGLLESVYEKALMIELAEKGLRPQNQVPIDVAYNGQSLGLGFRIDILVN